MITYLYRRIDELARIAIIISKPFSSSLRIGIDECILLRMNENFK